ncbi:MAG: outer membrane beta-barrel protein [Chitinispirillaceae bacterium]|nr:outer membrane beta-barrel protein [Chitinispirillaceae bacterium]
MKRTRSKKGILKGAAAFFAMLPMAVLAEFPDHGPYIGAYGGYNLKLGGWSLGVVADNTIDGSMQPKPSMVGGLRVGYHFLPQLTGEMGGGLLPLTSTAGGKNTALKADLDIFYHLLRGTTTPFVGLGAGAHVNLKGGDLGGDLDLQMHLSLGARGTIKPGIALRAEVRDYIIDDYSKLGMGQNLELTAGIDFHLGRAEKERPPQPPLSSPALPLSDRDNDAIPDIHDRCPDLMGEPELEGCPEPDQDSDGVPDSRDKCPQKAGPISSAGCPEKD